MRRRTALAISAALGALLWEPLTSVAMCGLLGTLGAVSKWVLPLAAYYYWRDHSAEPLVAYWFPLAAVGAAMVAALPALAVAAWPESRRLRLARDGEKIPEAQRARSDAFGSNDWMSMEEARRRFPGPDPQEGCGGVVVGEAYRVDRDPIANAIPFDPKNRETWGQGGKHPVLIDPCTADSSHGAVVSPSGGYKTTAVTIPTLAAFTTSVVVHDPSGQVEPMTARMRRAMGHKVASVGVEPGQGFNVLDCIDITDPLAETYVEEVVEQLVGETPVASENAIFTDSAKELLTCLLADLLWDPTIPPERKTLREFRERVRTPEKKMRGLLGDIAAESKSKLARDYAGSLAETVSETFSGVLRNAASSTKWLSIKAYADMVSGGSFKAADLTGGKLSVFVQIPIPTMKANPGIARVVFGALLGAAYRAKGAIAGRILFLLDEARFLGHLKALEDVRDAGRKYKITLVMMWQSIGQIIETWKEAGKTAWLSSCGWQLFAAVNDDFTAEQVSKAAGRFTILARSQSRSTGAQSGAQSSSNSSGWNESVSLQGHDLISKDKVRTMRADEAIIFTAGNLPLRCGRAIYFRRKELDAHIDRDVLRRAA